jgi:hypothetical protein
MGDEEYDALRRDAKRQCMRDVRQRQSQAPVAVAGEEGSKAMWVGARGAAVIANARALSLPWSTRNGLTWTLGLHSDAITRCRDQLGGSPSVPFPLGMDLTAWFGSQGVFSTDEAAHIFGSGPVRWRRRGGGSR